MTNTLPNSLEIHEKFDLKGSTHERYASEEEKAKENPTLKDLDFDVMYPNGLILDEATYRFITTLLAYDCSVRIIFLE